MEFRPCIDIHNGKVKQIVGSSLKDVGDFAEENFVSKQDARFYAEFYKNKKINGGHIILLNSIDSEFYEITKNQAILALKAYPGGLQIGGGITDQNAIEFLEAGASHVIVTSFVFKDGMIHYQNLEKIVKKLGKEHLVLDLSCRKKDGNYYIVTDRWQKFTREIITEDLLFELGDYCDEFLVHAVDVEGKASGIEEELVKILAKGPDIPITYAGGVAHFDHIKKLKELSNDRINITIGSALDLFGGDMVFDEVIDFMKLKIN